MGGAIESVAVGRNRLLRQAIGDLRGCQVFADDALAVLVTEALRASGKSSK